IAPFGGFSPTSKYSRPLVPSGFRKVRIPPPLAGPNTFVGPRFFDVGRSASDHEFVGDAAYIHLENEALHRRAREMPRQTARTGSAADDLVGQERMNIEDRIDLGRGHVRPAEAERRHALLHRPEHEARFLAHRLRRLVAAPNNAPFIAGTALARFAASGGDKTGRRAAFARHGVAEGEKRGCGG